MSGSILEPATSKLGTFSEESQLWRFSWVYGAIWLFYLWYPAQAAWENPSVFVRISGIALVAAFAVTFVSSFWIFRNGRRHGRPAPVLFAWAALCVLAAIGAALALMLGMNAIGTTIYIAVLAVMTLPTRSAWIVVALLALFTAIAPHVVPGWAPDDFFAFQLLVSAVAVWGLMQVIKRNHELALAREQLADLAVVAERDRMSRDMHDILGHSLTVITVKAELAGRLMDVDRVRATAEIADVELLARQALADVRSAVGGLRRVDIAAELITARQALTAAGIDAQLPCNADDVPPRNRELFGWTLREAVTNVIRHSAADVCSVEIEPDVIEVVDNGRGLSSPLGSAPFEMAKNNPTANGGNGLRGLKERVDEAGGSLTMGRSANGGLRLVVRAS